MTNDVNEELADAARALEEAEAQAARLKRMLKPYWERKRAIEKRIARTHRCRVTPIYSPYGDGQQIDERVDVIGYGRDGIGLRAPLFAQLDDLRLEFAAEHRADAEAKLQLASMQKLNKMLGKAAKKRGPVLL